MKRFLYLIVALGLVACNEKKQHRFDVAGISPSPFVGSWENVGVNDTVQDLSLRIGERNDSLLISFYWERQEPFYMDGNPLVDRNGAVIPQVCITVPKNGNKAEGTIVNQYFSVFQNYPENEYYPVVFELKSIDTLTFKIKGEVNYWPDSALLVRENYENYPYSTDVVDLYKKDYLVPDADISTKNIYDITGIEPFPFVGKWGWGENDSWHNFNISVGVKGDSLLIACAGVFSGGARIQMPEKDVSGKTVPQARLLAPKHGNKAKGRFLGDVDCAVTLELFSNNTLLFKTDKPIGFWPDSAVMVRINGENPVFGE